MTDRAAVARMIDHSLLRPDATPADIERLAAEAKEFGFYSVCVNPHFVPLAASLLKGTGAKVCAVVGFPLGMTLTGAKVFEAMKVALLGADEIDMVINIGAAKAGDWEAVARDVSDVVAATPGLLHKAIIEACYLDDDQKALAAGAALGAGVEFLKTSTGMGPGGATVEDVRLLCRVAAGRAGVKAAGGIRTLSDFMSMAEAGATRIGTSSGPAILKELGG